MIRTFLKDGTNFGMGHVDIPLESNVEFTNSMFMLNYFQSSRIFVRNKHKWTIFEVKDTYFIADTYNNVEEYRKLVNTTISGEVSACELFN